MTIEEASEIASVFAHSARLRIFRLLLESSEQGIIVGDIQKRVKISGPTLSHHLERLRDSGLVTIRRQGTFLWYLPVRHRLHAFAEMLLGLAAPFPTPTEPAEPVVSATAPEVEIEAD